MSAAKELAAKAVDNVEPLLQDMFSGGYQDNEVSLGVLLDGQREIQVQLKVTAIEKDFIETDYSDWDDSFKSLDQRLKRGR